MNTIKIKFKQFINWLFNKKSNDYKLGTATIYGVKSFGFENGKLIFDLNKSRCLMVSDNINFIEKEKQ